MSLAIFDLDNTLIAGDSDYLWGEFLVENKLVDIDWYQSQNKKFFAQYKTGILNINEWLEFQLQPLTKFTLEQLDKLSAQFIISKIKPIVLNKAQDKIEFHRQRNDDLLIITATNRYISRPVADLLSIDTLLATTPEIIDDRFTGRTTGVITYQEGKITALTNWLQNKQYSTTYFYSDSHNDLPLLEFVDVPIAVDPDEILAKQAQHNNWQIISFR